MSTRILAPWHKASFDMFLNERLPALLAERLPLAGYKVVETGTYTCRVTVMLVTHGDEVSVSYEDVPQPDETGVFQKEGRMLVVLPLAEHEHLETATIRCVGEQFYDFIAGHLGQAPSDLPWNTDLLRAWLPLGAWCADFMDEVSQQLETTNWLAHQTHLRSLLISECEQVIAPGQLGRVCPFETPEGPNIGRVLRVAMGAEICDGKLVVVRDQPEMKLGLSAAMIPFLEHDDPNRILMGANMLRQWVTQQTPEPALVQTGNEPDEAAFWNGRNLLTAFVSWGAGTFEDGIVISESCARRFNTPTPLQVGDKLSNRHGTKGVIGQISPDDAMPHLPGGMPVDLVFNFVNLHRRMNFGQIREAVMGRIAYTEGEMVIVPPFQAPDEAGLRARLVKAGLPESGMEVLTQGKNGHALAHPSTVGWVYWGRLFHLAQDKLHTYTDGKWGQVQGEMENYMLRDLGAFENIREGLNTRAVRRPDATTLPARVAAGLVEQAAAPTPLFLDLIRRLRVAGIETTLEDDEKLAFRFASPQPGSLILAQPVPHPWLRERTLTGIALPTPQTEAGEDAVWDLLFPPGGWQAPHSPRVDYTALVEANDRLARLLSGQTPKKLVTDAIIQLEARVQAFFDALLTPAHLRFSERLVFSGRAVLTPGAGLTLAQVGIPEEMAWALFSPLVIRQLKGDEVAVTARDDRAMRALDAVMAQSWVIINRAPTVTPTALLAFHPVRVPGAALQIHPLVCEWLSADFDGDQAAILLPITEAAQREAGEKLSVAAHLKRDPGLLTSLLPRLDALWGLAMLSQQRGGVEEIARLVGRPVVAPRGYVTRNSLAETLQIELAQATSQDSIEAMLSRLDHLMRRGFEVARASGASLAPFIKTSALLPPPPAEDPIAWESHIEEVAEALAAPTDCAPAALAPQCLMARAAGDGLNPLTWLIEGRGPVKDARGETVLVQHGYIKGYTPEEMFACVAGARRGLAQVVQEWEQMGRTFRERNISRSFNVLTRALRSQHPGLVFARAAALGEVDPLVNVESRLWVGLPV